MASTEFLKAIGLTDKVYIRCLAPKNTPIPELQTRGMTWTTKDGEIKKSTIDGYIDLQSDQFHQKYGDKFKPVTDGWGYIESLNQQGYGVYYVVHHGGVKNSEITHGTTLFHESDRATLEEQQQVIDRISSEFGKPTAVVKTRKSLHAYWSSSETISVDTLPTYQRRWMQYSNCDDVSLSDPAQLMRLPGFDHVAWNPEIEDFDRVPCELLQLNDVSYSLEQFDRYLPELDTNQWVSRSLMETVDSEASDTDMRVLAQYLDGYKENGRNGWDTAKCPAHNGESLDGLHIDRATGGFICHGGCSSSAIYNATKAVAVAGGHRFEVEASENDYIKSSVDKKLKDINSDYPLANLFPLAVAKPLIEYHNRTSVPQGLLGMALITCLSTLIHPESKLECFGGTDRIVKAIFWFCVYGLSGNGKSHSYDPLLKILKEYGVEAAIEYTERKKEYDALQKRVKRSKPETLPQDELDQADEPAPIRSRYVVESATIESLISCAARQPTRGLLMYADELIGWCNRMDPNKGEIEIWLGLKSGKFVDGLRQTREFEPLMASAISVMGGIQPDILKKLLTKQEEAQNGFVPRLTMVRFNETPTQPLKNSAPINYKDIKNLFDRVHCDSTPSTVYLDPRCLDLAEAWRIETDTQRLSESRKSIKALFSKFNELGYQIAFVLHIINRSLDPTTPEKIPPHTFDAAIGFARWMLNQSVSIHEELLESEQQETFISRFVTDCINRPVITRRDLMRMYGGVKFKTKDAAIKFTDFIVDLGRAEYVDKHKGSFRICPFKNEVLYDSMTNHTQTLAATGYGVSLSQYDAYDKMPPNADIPMSVGYSDKYDNFSPTDQTIGNKSISDDDDQKLSYSENDSEHVAIPPSQPLLSYSSYCDNDTSNDYPEKDTPRFVILSSENRKNDGQKTVITDESENLKSMADSLSALVQLSDDEALDGLNDLYSIWTPPQMSEASKLLKTTNPTAFDRLGELVVKRKCNQTEETIDRSETSVDVSQSGNMVIENNVVMEF